jgi:hypothetical protein
MKRLALLACAACAAAGCGAGTSSLAVHPDGRVGAFRIDETPGAQVRAKLGRPAKVERMFNEAPPGGLLGHGLVYRCGRGCTNTYFVNARTARLADYWLQSSDFATEQGSRVGMTRTEAARREHLRWRPGCGSGLYLYLRKDRGHQFVLHAERDRVDAIAYLGPHSTFYEGFC